MNTRSAILLAIGMLVLGLLIGGLTGGVAGFFMGQGSRAALSQRLLQAVPPAAQQPNQPQTQPNPRRTFPSAANVLGSASVQTVEKDSPAEKAGLQVGDIITAVGSTKLDANHALGDLIATYKPGTKVDLSVTRGTQTMTLTVELGANAQDSTKSYLGIRYSTIPGNRSRLPTN